MELWKELLISGLQNENLEFDFTNDKILKEIIDNKCYAVLLQIKQILNDENLTDYECYYKIEKIISKLEENNVFCNRHDFG